MKNKRTMAAALFITGLLTLSGVFTALAEESVITSVSLSVTVNIEPGCARGQEDIRSARTSGGHYTIAKTELLNDLTVWTENDSPVGQITLTADDGYDFSTLRTEDITLNGNQITMGLASKRDNSKTLLIAFTAPPLSQSMADVRNVRWSPKGVAAWDPVSNAGSYEIRLYRGDKGIGQTMTVTGSSYDFTKKMLQPGSYTFKIRAVSAANLAVKGEFLYSGACQVDDALAAAFKKGPGWERNDLGWWYRNADSSYPVSAWMQIDGNWYYFNEQGYMLENTVTPDGYKVDENGIYKAE